MFVAGREKLAGLVSIGAEERERGEGEEEGEMMVDMRHERF